jgi:hypothetical protein
VENIEFGPSSVERIKGGVSWKVVELKKLNCTFGPLNFRKLIFWSPIFIIESCILNFIVSFLVLFYFLIKLLVLFI